ncbi:MAG: DUF302 domain-containing protein [Candidatus Micrarchaeota archaeon]
MEYYYRKENKEGFGKAVERLKQELGREGFGVLTEIDVKATLKKKLGVESANYVILGACNPVLAHQALQSEKNIGVYLPCNVIVYDENGLTWISSVRPTVAMSRVGNEKLAPIAQAVEEKLKAVVDRACSPAL